MPPPEGQLRRAAALALGLVLAVVLAAAGIRLEIGIPGLRIVHRAAASLEVVAVLWLGWLAWRARAERPALLCAALLALGLTAFLSVVGIAAGQRPPPVAAAANLLGGLALTAVFAWILGGTRALTPIFMSVAALMGVQIVLGARLSIVERYDVFLPVHALLAMVLAWLLGWVALVRVRGAAGKVLFALALVAPAAGFSSLHYEYSTVAALVHATAVALFLASTAYALGRGA